MNRAWVAILAAGLSGCGTTQTPPPEPRIITVTVPAPCVPANFGAAPDYPDSDTALKAAPDAAERYRLLGQGRVQRIARERELNTVVAGCPKVNQ